MKTVYGPVPSWRMGKSLGIDPVCIPSEKKTCSFDCVYCQLGKTVNLSVKRRVFVDVSDVQRDLGNALIRLKRPDIDVITLSGTSEPTLAVNIGGIIDAIKEMTDIPVAVLTNSSLLPRKDVRKDLCRADIIVAKIDASNDELFRIINRPHPEIGFESIISGIMKMRADFDKKLCLQMMFLSENREFCGEIAEIARKIQADEVQINTPLRKPCSAEPLGSEEIEKIRKSFSGMRTICVYDAKRPEVIPVDREETLKRRPEL